MPFDALFEAFNIAGEAFNATNFCGLISLSVVEILLRGEHFPLENFIHSVNIGVLITKTPRISATSFSPPGGKKVSLHTYWQPTTLAPPSRGFAVGVALFCLGRLVGGRAGEPDFVHWFVSPGRAGVFVPRV